MSAVVDASFYATWILPDESEDCVMEVMPRLAEAGFWVPTIWLHKLTNILLMAERRARIPSEFVLESAGDLEDVFWRLDDATGTAHMVATIELARRHRLTAYDASYLELALRRGLPLHTLDRRLRDAAAAEGAAPR